MLTEEPDRASAQRAEDINVRRRDGEHDHRQIMIIRGDLGRGSDALLNRAFDVHQHQV